MGIFLHTPPPTTKDLVSWICHNSTCTHIHASYSHVHRHRGYARTCTPPPPLQNIRHPKYVMIVHAHSYVYMHLIHKYVHTYTYTYTHTMDTHMHILPPPPPPPPQNIQYPEYAMIAHAHSYMHRIHKYIHTYTHPGWIHHCTYIFKYTSTYTFIHTHIIYTGLHLEFCLSVCWGGGGWLFQCNRNRH